MSQPRELVIASVAKQNKTGSGTTLVKGTLVKLDASNDDGVVAATAASDIYFGVCREDIADDAWGNIGVIGRFLVLGGGSITEGARVTGTTGGKGAAAGSSSGNLYNYAAIAERAGASSTLFECWFSGPGQAFQAQ